MKKRKYIITAGILLIIVFVGVTLAKYITEDYHGYYISAKDFPFTSNILSTNHYNTHIIDNWSGVESFDITFDLSTKKNNLYYADYDVPYLVIYDCPETVTCSLSKTSGIIYASNPTHTDTVTLHVQPLQNFSAGSFLTFSVSAKSTAPYEKQLVATFSYFVKDNSISYTVTDYGPVYAKLTITNAISYYTVNSAFGDYSQNDRIDIEEYNKLTQAEKENCIGQWVNISFDPNDLLIDTTDSIIKDDNYTTTLISNIPYINNITTEIKPMSAIEIKFYKTDPTINYNSYASDNPAITVTQVNR